MEPSLREAIAAAVFLAALAHSFSTRQLERLGHRYPSHRRLCHLFAEVEVVFGFWAMVLVFLLFATGGRERAIAYVESRSFVEPLFVFAIMIVAGTRPVLELATGLIRVLARRLPLGPGASAYFCILFFVPLLGSLITEPAAMTLGAFMLRDQFLLQDASSDRFKYASVGTLFVNVSIGGVLTHFAAPPVLMVSAKWGWDTAFMLGHFGWRAALAVAVNALATTWVFAREVHTGPATRGLARTPIPGPMVGLNLAMLAGIVAFARHPPLFVGVLLLFLGVATAYPEQFGRLLLREALMVAFFLSGLVVLGGLQRWWLQPALLSMNANAVYFGATLLTGITDNAALTYLGSQVDGLSDAFKQMLVAGAVTGGGLTVIANAPNPAGLAILRPRFKDAAISPLALLAAAVPGTLVAVVAFRCL